MVDGEVSSGIVSTHAISSTCCIVDVPIHLCLL